MGFRCRWLATRGRDREQVLARLKFSVTTTHDAAVYDTGLYALEVNGWLVVFGDGWDYMDIVQRGEAQRLSDDGEVLYLYTDDTPMRAAIVSFVGGVEAWSIAYNGENGVSEPELAGKLPVIGEQLLATARAARARSRAWWRRLLRPSEPVADHIYDVVAELGRELTGFRHDRTLVEGKHLPVYALSGSTSAS
jgi:hypothetical protein